jgi:hypothetical protein
MHINPHHEASITSKDLLYFCECGANLCSAQQHIQQGAGALAARTLTADHQQPE